ncbi:uncharacterized protein LOC119090855 [Pollicipes pollicipes]|uniref:uncharacterized protein LOC119090855 n=1 Tax=Pollicipes pollicipes TaxID=41117 RepID=UPI0018853540|nr:uncharacterized protein LOC119090855 [Pollicipes pollicipes]
MAATAGFVQTVLASVCLETRLPSLPTVPPLTATRQGYSEACAATNDYLRLTDGQLIQWMRPSVTRDMQNRTIRLGVKEMPTAAYLNSTQQPDRWSFRVINILASVYNFTPEYVPVGESERRRP